MATINAQLSTVNNAVGGIAAAVKTLEASIPSIVHRCFQPLAKDLDNKFEARSAALEAHMAEQDTTIRAMAARLAKTEEELRVQVAQPKMQLAQADWDREVDGSIIVLQAREPVAQADMAEAVKSWLVDAGQPLGESCALEGDARLTTRHVLRFSGPQRSATLGAQKALRAMRLASGGWRVLEAAGAGGRRIAVSASADKSRRTVANEIALRKIKQALATAFPQQRFYVDRDAFSITSRWQPIIKVECSPVEPTVISWNMAAINTLQLDRRTMEPIVESAVRVASIEWVG